MAREPKINPYNFVPLPETPPERSPHRGLHRVGEDGWSGTLVCELRPLTPLFTADQRGRKRNNRSPLPFLRDGSGTPILQGTSLKGMVRSVYEALTNSCLCLAAPVREKKREDGTVKTLYRYQDLGEHANQACNSRDSLCPACRLFGTIEGDRVHLEGRVTFTDAPLVEGKPVQERIHLGELSTPKPRHGAIYGRNRRQGGPVAGRKLFYHHDPATDPGRGSEQTHRSAVIAEYVPPDGEEGRRTVFRFRIHFRDLDREEFGQLLWCLELEEGLAHKTGMAKPVGYGSCRVKVVDETSRVERGAGRYRSYERSAGPLPASNWRSSVETTRSEAGRRAPRELRKLLSWTGRPSGDVGCLSWRGYEGMGIDQEGRFVPVTPRQTGGGQGGGGAGGGHGGAGSGGAGFRVGAQVEGLAELLSGGGEPQPGTEGSKERKLEVGDRVRAEVIASDGTRHRLRIVDTGEEVDHEQRLPWTRGQRLKVRVKAVDGEGRVTAIRP